MKPGTVVLAELTGPVADRIHEIQRRFDPRMAAELPPHLTLSGSSGMGPIPNRVTVEELRAALEPVAAATAPFTVEFQPPMQFMQSRVVVLPVDPHGPIRELHDRIKTAGLEHEAARFTFTPHCTLNLYRELPAVELRELLAVRVREPATVGRIDVYRRVGVGASRCVLRLDLGGEAGNL